MMPEVLYKDAAGNKLYKKYIPSRRVYQYYATNKQGKIVNPKGFNQLVKRAGMTKKIGISTRVGIQKRLTRQGFRWF